MTIIVYVCDICNRKIELPQNKHGLEVIQRCIITHQCRGKLSKVETKPDFTRGRYPESVVGLEDWSQRRILFNHTQSIKTKVWIVIHNLGVLPSLQLFIERSLFNSIEENTDLPCDDRDYDNAKSIEQIELSPGDYKIKIINKNKIEIIFKESQSGRVQCIARAASPEVIVPTVVDEAIAAFQLTNKSDLSIATLNNQALINLIIIFIPPDGPKITVLYEDIDDTPSAVLSPWTNNRKLFIENKTYTTRSLDIRTIANAAGVPDGSFCYFADTTGLLILLSSPPYAAVDKIVDKIIDPTGVTEENAKNSFYYSNGQLFVYENLIETVYPHIRKI